MDIVLKRFKTRINALQTGKLFSPFLSVFLGSQAFFLGSKRFFGGDFKINAKLSPLGKLSKTDRPVYVFFS